MIPARYLWQSKLKWSIFHCNEHAEWFLLTALNHLLPFKDVIADNCCSCLNAQTIARFGSLTSCFMFLAFYYKSIVGRMVAKDTDGTTPADNPLTHFLLWLMPLNLPPDSPTTNHDSIWYVLCDSKFQSVLSKPDSSLPWRSGFKCSAIQDGCSLSSLVDLIDLNGLPCLVVAAKPDLCRSNMVHRWLAKAPSRNVFEMLGPVQWFN